ncbi:hypothetical protein SY27_00670 [Flavobacterium sp. 316]|nr:hypothetical protein SY27_00670 [Flavobacterium sp. 316]
MSFFFWFVFLLINLKVIAVSMMVQNYRNIKIKKLIKISFHLINKCNQCMNTLFSKILFTIIKSKKTSKIYYLKLKKVVYILK